MQDSTADVSEHSHAKPDDAEKRRCVEDAGEKPDMSASRNRAQTVPPPKGAGTFQSPAQRDDLRTGDAGEEQGNE